MNRKLIVLDVALAALVVYAGFQMHNQWLAAKARERAALDVKVQPLAPPLFTPLAAAPVVVPAGYKDIPQKFLFDRSRNSDVPVDLPQPAPAKPVPPLPVFHGTMNLGDGPFAVMSLRANSPHLEVHPGDPIGEFKLVEVNTQEVVLAWDGKILHKKVDEVMDRSSGPEEAAVRTPAPAAPAPVQEIAKTPTGPGATTGFGFKTCDPHDSLPEGTVRDGYRKTLLDTPFGKACRWEQVGR